MDSGIAALAEWSLKKAAMAAGSKSEMARLKSKITSCDWMAISARPRLWHQYTAMTTTHALTSGLHVHRYSLQYHTFPAYK